MGEFVVVVGLSQERRGFYVQVQVWHFGSQDSRSRGQRWIGIIVSALYTYGTD